MKLSQFKFDLPLNLIAQHPAKKREDSRMMVVHRKTGVIENKHFRDILEYFDDKDVFVVNNTKVFPARMYGRKEKTGAKIEVFLLRELNKPNRLWDVIVDPARKIRVGNKLYFGDNDELVAEVIDNTTSRGRTIRFLWDGNDDEFREVLELLGETPLPKYIKRKPDEEDKERYQTVYARTPGAVAAPTAGLHFDAETFAELERRGVRHAFVTLHVGAGTFQPVRVEDIDEHRMHEEYLEVTEAACSAINATRAAGGRVIAVGTTVVRSLESAAAASGVATSGAGGGVAGGGLAPYRGGTRIFIKPGHRFHAVDAMLTNFHLPESTLLMLCSAFVGREALLAAYAHAVRARYRFFSYGDAMFLIPSPAARAHA